MVVQEPVVRGVQGGTRMQEQGAGSSAAASEPPDELLILLPHGQCPVGASLLTGHKPIRFRSRWADSILFQSSATR